MTGDEAAREMLCAFVRRMLASSSGLRARWHQWQQERPQEAVGDLDGQLVAFAFWCTMLHADKEERARTSAILRHFPGRLE